MIYSDLSTSAVRVYQHFFAIPLGAGIGKFYCTFNSQEK